MDCKTKEYIERITQKIILEYSIELPIESMDLVVNKIGGVVEEKIGFDELTDGSIKKIGSDGFCIIVNKAISPEQRKFYLARQLGHLFLHMGFRTNLEIWKSQNSYVYRAFRTSGQFLQANEFASSFLIPKPMIQKLLCECSKNGYVNMSKLSKMFRVPISLVTVRMRSLRLIK